MVSSKHLGNIIREARKEAGLTQDDLSDKAGLAYSTLAKIEQGAIKSPSFFTVYALSEALGKDLGELFGKAKPGADRSSNTAPEKPKQIKFVYSDMNGVLIRFWHRAFAQVARDASCNLEVVENTFWHYNDAANTGEISLDEFNDAMSKRLGVKNIDWKEHYMSSVRPIGVMQDCLEEIQGKVKVGLLTNTMPGFVEELDKRGMLPKMKFDVVIDSSVEGIIKPSQAIYELAEKRCGYRGREILFIDDSRANLTAAEKLDWRVMWFDDFEPEESVRRLKRVVQES